MTTLHYKLAMGQLLVEGGQVAANLGRATRLIEQAAAEGCSIIVLPECLDLGWTDEAARILAEPIPGSHSQLLSAAARACKIYVVAGLVERAGPQIYNSAILISPDGTILLKHRKINELEIARGIYSTGQLLSVVATPLGVIGVDICADNLPESLEIGATLASMGAEIMLSPSSWAVPPDHDNQTEPYGSLWQGAYLTLATRHKLTVVGVSNVGWVRSGAWRGHKCIGCSLAIGADGEILAQGEYGELAESLIVVPLELKVARPVSQTAGGQPVTRQFQNYRS